ncbi:MAG: SDR family oxidoreductase [Lentisphaeria bacterium]|nr:SDR family oxidoreductase [Lentisphaeria bacterium]
MEKEVVIITGGAGYIGGTTAERFARSGKQVIIFDINRERVEEVASRIGAKGMVVNITDYREVTAAVEQVIAEFGKVDILVNAAGGSARSRMKRFADQDMEVIRDVIDMNLYGCLNCTRAIIPSMISRKSGVIVNISSAVALGGIAGCVDYGASKGAIIAATKGLAIELGQDNIRVNCVCPGKVQRPAEQPADPHAFAYKHSYLNYIATADDVADLVEFLASSKARYITGQNYVIDGGRSLGLRGDVNRTDS